MNKVLSGGQLFNNLQKLPSSFVHYLRSISLALTGIDELLQSYALSFNLLSADIFVLVTFKQNLLCLCLIGPQPHPYLLQNFLPIALVTPIPDVSS